VTRRFFLFDRDRPCGYYLRLWDESAHINALLQLPTNGRKTASHGGDSGAADGCDKWPDSRQVFLLNVSEFFCGGDVYP